MNIIPKDIPAKFQLRYCMEHGEEMPGLVVEQNNVGGSAILFPAFVHRNKEAGGYDWIIVRIPYKGQRLDDYEKLERQCYAELREYFYGTSAQQLELQYKGRLNAHINAVRKVFLNPYKVERRTVFTRFEVLKAFKAIPELYDQLVAAYQANIEVQLFWNSVLDVDLEDADCIRIRQVLGITDEMVDTLVEIIENASE
jgi:hypothetical protein